MEKFNIAQRIRAFRKLKGYTQNELADQLGVSIAILGAIERGTRNPDPKMLQHIAGVLGIEVEELSPTVTR
ncbi:transcriptional regulator [Gordoniibacillus kamchatkensis]|uniref:Transcriptional regulator n=1 Tax=Gordoniibacillus kamchatkensis TaxID=1590651 RepID=A0ABR5AEJ1_9BACL|nr:helix-turn-helix transcriptional regulator [Paenibacillus sp. VKM B-2647]KIL39380.1 transcriptional regulator [Paenibacillus sp. VKM B-2647]